MAHTDQTAKDELADAPAPLEPAGTWRLDSGRSTIGFGVRKLGLYTVRGRFRRASGELRIGDAGVPLTAQLAIESASVTTRMPPRDLHLRSGQFLAARTHPAIRVVADTLWYDDEGATLRADATLAIRDVTKRIRLRAHPHAEDAAVALHVRATLDRRELGVTPPPPFSWVVGREIALDALLVYVGRSRAPGP